MTLMMSDSLKDIVSIGQLTGEESVLTVVIDGIAQNFVLFSFVRADNTLRAMAHATKIDVAKIYSAKDLTASATFEGLELATGEVISIGYEPVTIGQDVHDMVMVHIKRDN